MKNLIYLTLIMAISCKKDQPIFFEDPFNCLPCGSDYCIPVESGDTSQIQVDLTAIGENLITNGDFASSSGWTLGAFWTIGSGIATWANSGSADGLVRNLDVPLVAGYYMVTMDITQITMSSTVLEVDLGGEQLGGTINGSITPQTIKFIGYISSPSNNELELYFGFGNPIKIDNVAVYRLSEAQYTIQDCETEEVFYSDTTNVGISYFEIPNLAFGDVAVPPNYFDIYNPYAIITLDWDSMDLDTDRCYCMCIKDKGLLGYEYIKNGTFASTAFWTILNTGLDGWAITGGQAVHTPEIPGSTDAMIATLVEDLDPDLTYTLTFDVIDATSWQINYQINSASYAGDTPINGSGNTTVSVNFSGGILGEPVILFQLFVGATNDSIIDNVSLKVSDVPCVTSNCISLKESWDTKCAVQKMCNILVKGTNTYSAFGFASNYDFKGRVFGILRNASYPDVENVEYKDLTGLKSLQYNDNEKIIELQVYAVPQPVHDWLRLALRCETLTLAINSVEKTFIKKGGDYSPNYRKTNPDASVIVEIQEVQQVSAMSRNV